jgi:hypothetical protein
MKPTNPTPTTDRRQRRKCTTKSTLQVILAGLALFQPIDTLATDWIIGFNQQWNTAVGEVRPSKEGLGIVDSMKNGLFADPEDSLLWQAKLLNLMGQGLLPDRQSTVRFAPGISVPAQSMSEREFADVNQILTKAKASKGEKVLACITEDDDRFEIWTTEGIYANGYGGGLAGVEKTNFGWRYRPLMLDGTPNSMETIKFWDLALSNDSIEQIDGPQGAQMLGTFVRLDLERTIPPKAKVTFIAVEPAHSHRAKHTDRILLIQKECRQFLARRITQALDKKAKTVKGHSGFRSAKWGCSFEDASRALTPLLRHDADQPFLTSRATADIGILYGNHISRELIANPVKADRWKALLELQSQQVATSPIDLMGIERATAHFAGQPNRLSGFVAETGIPLAPDLDYWSYDTPQGRYTAWFIDNRFYAVQIEPSAQAAPLFAEVMDNLSKRYGTFTDRPQKNGSGSLIHEDTHGGTLVIYTSKGSTPSISRIYHYSLEQRPSVKKKMESLAAESLKQTNPVKPSFGR